MRHYNFSDYFSERVYNSFAKETLENCTSSRTYLKVVSSHVIKLYPIRYIILFSNLICSIFQKCYRCISCRKSKQVYVTLAIFLIVSRLYISIRHIYMLNFLAYIYYTLSKLSIHKLKKCNYMSSYFDFDKTMYKKRDILKFFPY